MHVEGVIISVLVAYVCLFICLCVCLSVWWHVCVCVCKCNNFVVFCNGKIFKCGFLNAFEEFLKTLCSFIDLGSCSQIHDERGFWKTSAILGG